MTQGASQETRADVRREAGDLLAQRLRLGLCVVLFAIALFAIADLWLDQDRLRILLPIRLLQTALTLSAFFAIGRSPVSWPRALTVALLFQTALCFATVLPGVTRQAVGTAPLLFIVLAMATATLFPWGGRLQLVSVAVAALAILWNAHAAGGIVAAGGYQVVASTVAFAASVYIAHALELSRFKRRQAEKALQASTERLESEARISAALAKVAHDMISSLDQPAILDRLCLLTTEVLECDCSFTLLRQPGDDRFALVAEHGDLPSAMHALRGLEVPRTTIEGLLDQLERHGLIQIVVRDAVQMLPAELSAMSGVSVGLYAALRRGDDVVGIHAAGYRTGTEPFTTPQQRIARGIAQLASMALANARLVEEIERAARLKSEFVSTMSHELRTPLNVILGFAEMLEDESYDSRRRSELLEGIKVSGRELLELVENTLEVGRIEAGRGEVRLEAVKLQSFWTTLGQDCARMPRRDEVRLEWAQEVPDVSVLSDPRKLTVVIRNLVNNALKFTEQGWVRADVQVIADTIVVTVADTGIGIPREEQEAVFDLFRQADASDARRFGGTGLGLYIVRQFVRQLGGRIDVDSAPGRGSLFRVTIPTSKPVPLRSAA